jgi:integrase
MLRRTRKAGQREGYIGQRKDGRWEFKIQLDGVKYQGYGASKSDVREKRDEAKRHHTSGRSLPKTMRFTDLADRWFSAKVASSDWQSPATAESHRYQLSLILPRIGHVRIDKLNVAHLEDLYADLLETRATSTVNQTARTLSNILGWAWKRDWVFENIAKKAATPSASTRPKLILSKAEANQLIQGSATVPNGLTIEVMLLTGMRLQELLNLRWSDVDLPARTITVSVSKGRTAGSGRVLPLEPMLAVKLTKHRAEQNAQALRLGPDWQDGDFVFASQIGTAINPPNIRNRILKPLVKALGLPAVTPHGLRHWYGSYLISLGVPITTVSALMGHSNPATTMRIYAHELREDVIYVGDKLSALRAV